MLRLSHERTSHTLRVGVPVAPGRRSTSWDSLALSFRVPQAVCRSHFVYGGRPSEASSSSRKWFAWLMAVPLVLKTRL